MSPLCDVTDAADLKARVAAAGAAAVHFWAPWCEPCTAVDEMLSALNGEAPAPASCAVLRVEAEALPDVAEAYGVSAVPCVAVFKAGERVATVEGVNPPALAAAVREAFNAVDAGEAPAVGAASAAPSPADDLDGLIRSHKVMLFMKGSPDAPYCGFSRKVVARLHEIGHPFGHFDILTDEDVRQKLKAHSQWPTYPQLYVDGEFLGGNDIVQEMAESGELKKTLDAVMVRPADDLDGLIRSHKVMLFMKGSPDAPYCGFSRKVVARLHEIGHPFGHFDILTDEDVRQKLKAHSQWPTYPQLYVDGEFLGGNDIVQEMAESGELKKTLDAVAQGAQAAERAS